MFVRTLRHALAFFTLTLLACRPETQSEGDPCEVVSISQKEEAAVQVYISPDGRRYAENRRDANGIYQVLVGGMNSAEPAVCITCTQPIGGPVPSLHKLMVVWHLDSEWLFVGVEIPHERLWFISAEQDLAQMQSGLNLNMFVTRGDGGPWYRLVDFTHQGYTGPAVAPDNTLYWARIVSGNIFQYTFGQWILERADFVVDGNGIPSLANITDVTPSGANWIEPGNVSPDGKYLVLTADIGLPPNKAGGMDQWILDRETGALTNLNNSPKVWDEHGIFAPNSKKIVYMSSASVPSYDATTAFLGIWGVLTDFFIVDVDGSNQRQLTHFHDPGHVEYTEEDNLAAVAFFNPDGSQLIAAQLYTGARFPNQVTWILQFAGRCGGDGGID